MNTKKYTKYCIFGWILLLFLTVLFNRLVDPFWYYRDISIDGFNAIKTEYHSYEDQIKPILIKETRPEVLIVSNSYLEVGFNPLHPRLTENGKYRSYNYGIGGAAWGKVYCNVLYSLDHTALKTVVIGIQPGPLPLFDCNNQNQSINKLQQKTLLLSFDALRASFNTVRRQYRTPTHNINGMSYFHRNNGAQIEQVFKNNFDRYVKYPVKKNCKAPNFLEIPSWSYPNSGIDTDGLKNILNLLVASNIKVKLVVYPNHALWMELLMGCGDIKERWQYLYQIANVVDSVNKNSGLIELWDFQGTSEMLTERIVNGHVKYWQDIGHFNYEMGDAMLDMIYRGKSANLSQFSDNFGVLLTSASIVDRFYSFFKNRKVFLEQNPWFLEDFNKFAK